MTKTAERAETENGTQAKGLKGTYEEIGRNVVELLLEGVENPLAGFRDLGEPDPDDEKGCVLLLAAWLRARERRNDPKVPTIPRA